MAGLAPHAANFFKFLFVLVLYSMAMTLFVSILTQDTGTSLDLHPLELFAWHPVPERRHCYPTLSVDGTVSDDICRFLRPFERHTPRPSMVAMAVSPEVYT